MTEGIIQQWFKQKCSSQRSKSMNATISKSDVQELIEKIKQESFDIEFKTYKYTPVIFTNILIGDNK